MTLAIILSVEIVIGLACLILGAIRKPRNTSFLASIVTIIVLSGICFFLVYSKKREILYTCFSLFLLTFSWMLLFIYRLIEGLNDSGAKKNIFLCPVLYTTLASTVISLLYFINVNIFSLTYTPFLGNRYWGINANGITLHVWRVLTGLALLFLIIKTIFGIRKIAVLYRSRSIFFAVSQVIFLASYAVVETEHLPVFLLVLLLLPLCVATFYLVYVYPTSRLRSNALNVFTEDLADSFALYNEAGKLILVNGGLKKIISAEMLESFNSKKAFETWVEDVEIYNELPVKKIITPDGDEHFYEADFKIMQDGNHYLGTLYTLKDITNSIQKLQALDLANEELEHAAKMKSDFLANMSHEIRTPMNAVIGMAEMALRENLPENATSYIHQIKSSGRNLLNIINDILDFSKIESGKMDIVFDQYEPLSEINDVANILVSRIGDKPIELIVESDPHIPISLEGDMMRIRQIIVNLATNAIKFTKKGQVLLNLTYEALPGDKINLKLHVIDTGVGIKKSDINKLFTSFQQLDSKRNRTVEGTGLGLAITKQLLTLMQGKISVASEFEQGSDFSFELPQKVHNWTPSVSIKEPGKMCIINCFTNSYLADSLDRMAQSLELSSLRGVHEELIGRKSILFFEDYEYNEEIKARLETDSECEGIMLVDFNATAKPDLPNIRVIKKPLTTIVLGHILNHETLTFGSSADAGQTDFGFTAPDATVLIVDDNAVNITVAEGLISPIGMKVFTAESGYKALDLVKKNHFDIIFMDHMMPELDGVETTRMIRKEIPSAKDVPIIALTANAVAGAKEMFLKEGMNDFVPKPIELRTITTAVRRWIPKELIKNKTAEEAAADNSAEANSSLDIPGLDTESALSLIGSKDLYMKVAKDYFKKIDESAQIISNHLANEDWKNYTIQVHALKSSSRQIGATDLASLAEQLEKAGNNGDTEFIRENTDAALSMYSEVKSILAPFFSEEEEKTDLLAFDEKAVTELLNELNEACDSLDMDAMEAVSEKLKNYEYDNDWKASIDKLYKAIDDVDTETCQEIIKALS